MSSDVTAQDGCPDDEAVWHKLPKLKIRDHELRGQIRYNDLLILADPSRRVT